MSAKHYVIRGGSAGRERLRVLARVMWPTTSVLLERVGVAASSRCLDLGCGGGDVTVALARLAPDGFVVGADMDEPQLDVARREAADAGLANVDYQVLDVMQPASDNEQFDLIYARFLLTHLPDPSLALTHMCARLARAVHSWSKTSTSRAISVTRTNRRVLALCAAVLLCGHGQGR